MLSPQILRLSHRGRVVAWTLGESQVKEILSTLASCGAVVRASEDLDMPLGSQALTVLPAHTSGVTPQQWETRDGIEVLFDLVRDEPLLDLPTALAS